MALSPLYQLPLFPLEKRCYDCGDRKPLSDFHRNRSTRDGYAAACKDCSRRTALERYHRNRDANIARMATYRDEHKEYFRERYALDPVKGRERARQWRRNNPNKAREIEKRYRAKNRAVIRAILRRSYAKHKTQRLIDLRNERARRRDAPGTFTHADLDAIYASQQGLCYYCGALLVKPIHIDHKTPISRGGTNWPDNLALSCAGCNLSKGAKTEAEFVAWRAAPSV